MIDLTPLDVRKKRGDFRQKLRGYDPEEVDTFLELVEGRMEVLVKENLALQDKARVLEKRLETLEGREEAVQDALVSAQALRKEVQEQARRDAEKLENQVRREVELLKREAEAGLEARFQEAQELMKERQRALEDLERNRQKFLKAFRSLLERELDAVEVEESRKPLEDAPLDLELRGWKRKDPDELKIRTSEEVLEAREAPDHPEAGPGEEGLEVAVVEEPSSQDDPESVGTETEPGTDATLPEDRPPEEDLVGSGEETTSEEDALQREEPPSKKDGLRYEYDLAKGAAPSLDEALSGEVAPEEEADDDREEGTDEPLWLSALLERQGADGEESSDSLVSFEAEAVEGEGAETEDKDKKDEEEDWRP